MKFGTRLYVCTEERSDLLSDLLLQRYMLFKRETLSSFTPNLRQKVYHTVYAFSIFFFFFCLLITQDRTHLGEGGWGDGRKGVRGEISYIKDR